MVNGDLLQEFDSWFEFVSLSPTDEYLDTFDSFWIQDKYKSTLECLLPSKSMFWVWNMQRFWLPVIASERYKGDKLSRVGVRRLKRIDCDVDMGRNAGSYGPVGLYADGELPASVGEGVLLRSA